jgi:hypothetical protein
MMLAWLGACGTLDVQKTHQEAPLFQQINARVGKTFSTKARIADTKDTLARAEIGKISVGRFDQAFDAMFSETVKLPLWPPWQKADLHGFDGVIQLEDADANFRLGNDLDIPDFVDVHYRVCLYEADLMLVACWSADATQSYQRKPFECLASWNDCFARLLETAVRDAVAIIMTQMEKNAAVEAWAEKHAAVRNAQ